MSSIFTQEAGSEPLEVVIAGGGVAALESLLSLHALAGNRVRTRIVSPNTEYVHRALSVGEPFGLTEPRSWDVGEIAHAQGAAHIVDALASVDADRRVAVTASGRGLDFDALILATGARSVPAIAGALTFSGPEATPALARVLQEAERGEISSIAFAAPSRIAWTLPIYELALLTAAHLATRGVRGVELSVTTAERAPLALFGYRASDSVAHLLAQAGITLLAGDPSDVDADRVVALPRLEAPAIGGVPVARDGFIRTDLHCRVEGLDDVYAAGDATWFPVKQGGIAAQQADVAAAAIASQAGAAVATRVFRPVLRGALLTGDGVTYIRHTRRGDTGPTTSALWWPPAKVAGRYLGPYLAGEAGAATLEDLGAGEAGGEQGMIAMALEAADADAGWGDYGAALRWLGVAERLALVLPDVYAEKRERWHEALAGVV